MRILVRKARSLRSALANPASLPHLVRRNWLQFKGWMRGGRPWRYHVFEDVPFICIPSDDTSLRICQSGYAETVELGAAYHWTQPGDTCIDVGANVGVYSAVLAHRAGPSGCIFALEPSPRAFVRLVQLLETLEFDQVTAVAACASDRAGVVSLYVADTADAGPEQNSMRVSPDQRDHFRRRLSPAVSLDALLTASGSVPPVAVLKVDVEGAEPLVLSAAAAILAAKDRPLVVVEVHLGALATFGFTPADVLKHLPESDYERVFVPRSTSDSRPGRQFGGVYRVSDATDWPFLSNIIAFPRGGSFAARRSSIPFIPDSR